MSNASTPSVSIVILTRDRLPRLQACLNALQPQLAACDEIVVLDTGSKDGTREFLANAQGKGFRFLEYHQDGSWAEARNAGVRASNGELIAFLDDDCVPARDWVERGRANLGEVEAVGGYVAPGGIETWPEWWDARMGWLVGLSVPGHLGEYAGSYFYPYTSNLWTRAALVREEPFQEIGGTFGENNEKRYLAGREDAEWWRRIRVKGHFTRFDPKLRVAHFIEPERLRLEYLTDRARRDGEAWARREGQMDDLEAVAYQTWRWQYFERRENNALGEEANAPPAYQAMMLERHRAALAMLAEKLAKMEPHGPGATRLKQVALLRSGRRFVWNRAKTVARRMSLAFSPTPSWTPPQTRPDNLMIAAFGHVGDFVILQSCLRGFLAQNKQTQLEILTDAKGAILLDPLTNTKDALPPIIQVLDDDGQVAGIPWAKKIQSKHERVTGNIYVIAPYLHPPRGPKFLELAHSTRQPRLCTVSFDRDNGLVRMMHQARIQKTIHKDFTLHESENLRRLLGLGTDPPMFDADPMPPALAPSNNALRKSRQWHESLPEDAANRPLLFLNPDAAYRQKEWPEENWIQLLGSLLDASDCAFAVNLSRPGHPLKAMLEARFRNEARIAPLDAPPLDEMIAVMSLCRAVVTVDSAPQHLAHALDLPSLTLYGPMDERRWGDRWKRPLHRTIRGGMSDLTPEERRGLAENHLMRLISPERVLREVMELLRGN